jgi:hypothetical protein
VGTFTKGQALCMYVCMYVHVTMYVCMYVYLCMYLRIFMYLARSTQVQKGRFIGSMQGKHR